MIILRLRGGLGNQLFQYAAAKALAQHHNTCLKLDLYFYKVHSTRKFELLNFNIPIEVASREEIHAFTGSNPISRFINKRENYFRCPSVFVQPHYHYYPDFISLPASIYLSGYFQSELYFEKIASDIRTWYTPSIPLDDVNQQLVNEMRQCESVGVHVRRGDYTSNAYSSFFGTVPDEYYQESIEMIKKSTQKPKFFVFSDNILWCKKNLRLNNVEFVEHNQGADSFKDLVLMSNCKHNIIANSTFSWWGAWLNSNPEKLVIAPNTWFRKLYYDGKIPVYPSRIYNTKDLIPPQWHLM